MVPIKEMVDVLKVVREMSGIKRGSWVRIKRGMFKDDIARVSTCICVCICVCCGHCNMCCRVCIYLIHAYVYVAYATHLYGCMHLYTHTYICDRIWKTVPKDTSFHYIYYSNKNSITFSA